MTGIINKTLRLTDGRKEVKKEGRKRAATFQKEATMMFTDARPASSLLKSVIKFPIKRCAR